MLKKEDFIWKQHHENNISTNPLGEYYCIVDCGDYARKYGIVPQYPAYGDGEICIKANAKPEYYVLFESRGRKATKSEQNGFFYEMVHFDGYMFENNSFIRVFKTLDEAKARAYIQYKSIFGYVLSHIEPNTDLATAHHFCVK